MLVRVPAASQRVPCGAQRCHSHSAAASTRHRSRGQRSAKRSLVSRLRTVAGQERQRRAPRLDSASANRRHTCRLGSRRLQPGGSERAQPLRAVVARARHAQGSTGRSQPKRPGQLTQRLDHHRSSDSLGGRLAPSSCATFFWTSLLVPACVRRACKRAFSLRKRTSSSCSGSLAAGGGPHGCGISVCRAARARSLRHFEICEVEIPSQRRSTARGGSPSGDDSYSCTIGNFAAARNWEVLLERLLL